jgi:hypothetical protein
MCAVCVSTVSTVCVIDAYFSMPMVVCVENGPNGRRVI